VVDDQLGRRERVGQRSGAAERHHRVPTAARSTTAGTPVKSWRRILAGEKASSRAGAAGSHRASASTSASVTATPSMRRRRFSSSTLREYGSVPTSPPAVASGKTVCDVPPTSSTAVMR
jgi:hypothetical protein